jgi:hypothetical protein
MGSSGSGSGIEGVGGVGGARGTPEPKSTRPLPKKVRASLELGFGLNLKLRQLGVLCHS